MINYKRIIFIDCFFIFFILLFIFIDKKGSLSALTGFLIGVINFFLIALYIKFIFSKIKTKIKRIIFIITAYFIKIILFGLIIFLLITKNYLFNFTFFFIGFTLSLIPIIIESLVFKKKEN